eukprot:m.90141 g.90141  ORF g.90141 m.90141 type:complete len:898 (-) comp8848_c0_seq1:149-2842(-)
MNETHLGNTKDMSTKTIAPYVMNASTTTVGTETLNTAAPPPPPHHHQQSSSSSLLSSSANCNNNNRTLKHIVGDSELETTVKFKNAMNPICSDTSFDAGVYNVSEFEDQSANYLSIERDSGDDDSDGEDKLKVKEEMEKKRQASYKRRMSLSKTLQSDLSQGFMTLLNIQEQTLIEEREESVVKNDNYDGEGSNEGSSSPTSNFSRKNSARHSLLMALRHKEKGEKMENETVIGSQGKTTGSYDNQSPQNESGAMKNRKEEILFDEIVHQEIKELHSLRTSLGEKCTKQFKLENQLRSLDEQIGLLLHHRITVEEIDARLLTFDFQLHKNKHMSKKRMNMYGQLFKALHDNPHRIAILARMISTAEIDDFLQTIMFSLYGSLEPREEHLLLKVFEHALSVEYTSAKDSGTVMRSNSAISRMMTTFTRRGLGQKYLKDTLRTQIELLYDLDDTSLEINTEKVYQELELSGRELPPYNANSCFDIDELKCVVQEHGEMLMEITDRVLEAITISIPNIPYGVRWLCKVIREQCESRFSNISVDTVYSHIGGFFLLRYINPALVSPEASGIMRQKPNAPVRKNLTQVARFLQQIANNTSSKFPLLSEMETFINLYRVRLFNLFDDICDVKDFSEDYKLEMIDAVSQTGVLTITPNELFFVHKLLIANIDEMHLGGGDKDFIDLVKSLPKPSEKLARDANGPFKLILQSVEGGSPIHTPIEPTRVYKHDLESVRHEKHRLVAAIHSVDENIVYLMEKKDSYKQYLDNVRGQSVSGSTLLTEFVGVGFQKKRNLQPSKAIGPFNIKLTNLDKKNIVLHSNPAKIPSIGTQERNHVIVLFSMPRIGHVVFTVKFKGKVALAHIEQKFEDLLYDIDEERPVMKLGDLLEFDAKKMLVLLDKTMFA